jgi:hypothetical protein
VANTCNPSFQGGRDQEDHGSKPAQPNSSKDSILKKKILKKGLEEWPRCRPWVQTPVAKKNSKLSEKYDRSHSTLLLKMLVVSNTSNTKYCQTLHNISVNKLLQIGQWSHNMPPSILACKNTLHDVGTMLKLSDTFLTMHGYINFYRQLLDL